MARAFSFDLNDRSHGASARAAVQDLLANEGLLSQDVAQEKFFANRYEVKDLAAQGMHTAGGKVKLAPAVARNASTGLANLAAGDAVSTAEARAISTVIHEEIHGASRNVAVAKSAYRGAGVGIEEAATEILARRVSRRMIPSGQMPGPSDMFRLPSSSRIFRTFDDEFEDRMRRASALGIDDPTGFETARAYDAYIGRFLKAPRAAGYSDEQIEAALIEIRSGSAGDRMWTSEFDQGDHFAEVLSKSDPATPGASGVKAREGALKRGIRQAELHTDYPGEE